MARIPAGEAASARPPEPIRLIIWDLDETFWRGTLTEGGISYVKAHHDLVIEFAKRGIMSSICSKNEFAPIRERLTKEGIWDYFIFPSINWEAKGPRLKALVEAVQLRPETILFIDDNAMNRNEAAHFVPGLQVADETVIPSLLDSKLCRGKDDAKLSRLAQYKLLETKQAEQADAGDNREFLRASNIRVTIEHDLEPHMDRVIELINRTNQLNFTKRRLPEDQERAREQLRRHLGEMNKTAGLVHVEDRYGDYGFTGFYLMNNWAADLRLEHFCFSCRTLGMGVESWLYDRLGRPKLKVVGEVLTDLSGPRDPIDWINRADSSDTRISEQSTGRIFIRGGCNMSNLAHYLALNADEVISEFNVMRGGLAIRIDHSLFLRYAFEGVPPAAMEAWTRLGYDRTDFQSVLADNPDGFDVCVFSFITDALFAIYEHPEAGLPIPFFPTGIPNDDHHQDARTRRWRFKADAALTEAADILEAERYRHAPPSASVFADTLTRILAFIPPNVTLFFLLGPETFANDEKQLVPYDAFVEQNRIIRTRTAGRPDVHLMHVLDFVRSPSDRLDRNHFNRMVYFRVYQKIAETLRAKRAGMVFAGAKHDELLPIFYLADTHGRYIAAAAAQGLLGARTVRGQIIPGGTITPFGNPNVKADALATFRSRLIGRDVEQIIVIQLGEADVAHVLWLTPSARLDVTAEIDTAVARYFAFVDEIHAAGFQYLVITGATLPTINDDEQLRGVVKGRAGCGATQRDRTDATLAFNARLKRQAEKRGLQYADIAEDALDPVTKLARRSLRNRVPTELPMRIDAAAALWATHLSPCLAFYDAAAARVHAAGAWGQTPSNRLVPPPMPAKIPQPQSA